MIRPLFPYWYIDVRSADTPERLSLDLTRHLPRRLSIGPAVIVTPRPSILLPVVRKRWMRIVREVERQRASTLDRVRRAALEHELKLMRSLRFTTKVLDSGKADVVIIEPSEAATSLPRCTTLYLLAVTDSHELTALVGRLANGSTIVVYEELHGQTPLVLSVLRRIATQAR